MKDRPRLLVISHFLPFPRKSGQQQRVYYILKTARKYFDVTLLTIADSIRIQDVQKKLLTVCDDVIILPPEYSGNKLIRLWHKAAGFCYILHTGLKLSNYIISQLKFHPKRIVPLIESKDFDCALLEYWHAAECVSIFHKRGIPCVLDMHNVLWQSYMEQLNKKPALPAWLKRWIVRRYKMREEQAWKQFDGIVAINTKEYEYVQSKVPNAIRLFYAPMGTGLELWSYLWEPSQPPRIAYYGGLGNARNQHDALTCYKRIMPEIWREFPKAELWLVGSNPAESLRALSADSRVKVTGYVENVQEVLRTMWVVICPFSGRYGFRSRLIEVMALGVPVVASHDAVYGMEIDENRGVLLGNTDKELIEHCLRLLREPAFARQQSVLARHHVEERFSLEATYGKLAKDLYEFVHYFNMKTFCFHH